MILVFLGKPGSGKGTQAKFVSEKLKIPVITMGQILRNIEKENTPLAQEVKERIDRGELVPDKLVLGILKERLQKEDCRDGYILDGFPRNLNQAKTFEARIEMVFYIKVSDEAIIRRLSSRRECPQCGRVYNLITNPPEKDEICDFCEVDLIIREDDKLETIKKRLEVYRKETEELIDYYKQKGLLVDIDGEKPINQVFEEIMGLLKKAAL